uniref:Uncharacterized protein n=1 Tax=Aegilops tauschii subsp. strangulata TaxID=200361 RepID=A0A453FZ31_AEGTS
KIQFSYSFKFLPLTKLCHCFVAEDDFVDQEKKCYVHFPTIAWQSSYTCHHLPTACNNLIAKFNTVNVCVCVLIKPPCVLDLFSYSWWRR